MLKIDPIGYRQQFRGLNFTHPTQLSLNFHSLCTEYLLTNASILGLIKVKADNSLLSGEKMNDLNSVLHYGVWIRPSLDIVNENLSAYCLEGEPCGPEGRKVGKGTCQ
jgi:hypothetical protein